jgi:hypothetical protein
VSSFFCGCADLRKGALIIGIVKLVLALIQVAYTGYLLFAFGSLASFGNGRSRDSEAIVTASLVVLGLMEVVLIGVVIVNALLIHAAVTSKTGAGHTLPWLIVNMIGIVFGVLALLGKSWFSFVDVPLSIYFWIVVKSYRTQLKEGTQATV